MKKLLIILFSLGLGLTGSAQMKLQKSVLLDSESSIKTNDDLGDFSKRKRGKAGSVGIGGAKQFIGAVMPIPIGDFADVSNGGIGFEASPVFFFDHFGIGLLFGYHSFTSEDVTYDGFFDRPSLTPIMLQGMYLFGEDKFLPYAGIAAGVYSQSDFGGEKAAFGFSPQGGVIFAISQDFQFYFNARYNMLNLKYDVPDGNGGTVTEKYARNYVSFTLGIGFPYTDPYRRI